MIRVNIGEWIIREPKGLNVRVVNDTDLKEALKYLDNTRV